MLAPVSEAEFGERELLELGMESARRYPEFVAPLEDAGYREVGTLVVARDRDEAEALDRLAAFRAGLGLPGERLLPSQARRVEPALAPTVRLALDIPGDHSIDPRKLVAALRAAFAGECAGRPSSRSWSTASGSRACAPTPARSARAPWSWPPACTWRGSGCRTPRASRCARSRAVVLRLRGEPLVERTIRGESVYFVPRGDGSFVLGATMEERGWDTTPTAGGIYELLRDLSEIVPGVLELHVEERARRPASGDAGQPARPSARARSRGSSGPPGTSATASCSRP